MTLSWSIALDWLGLPPEAEETVDQFLLELRALLEDPDATNYSDTELRQHLSAAVRAVYSQVLRLNPQWFVSLDGSTQTTIAVESGTADYDIPARTGTIVAAFLDGSPLRRWDVAAIGDAYQRTIAAGQSGYLLVSGKLRLVPAPTAGGSLILYAVERPALLTGNAQAVPYARAFRDALLRYACVVAKTRNYEAAANDVGFLQAVQAFVPDVALDANNEDFPTWRSGWSDFSLLDS